MLFLRITCSSACSLFSGRHSRLPHSVYFPFGQPLSLSIQLTLQDTLFYFSEKIFLPNLPPPNGRFAANCSNSIPLTSPVGSSLCRLVPRMSQLTLGVAVAQSETCSPPLAARLFPPSPKLTTTEWQIRRELLNLYPFNLTGTSRCMFNNSQSSLIYF